MKAEVGHAHASGYNNIETINKPSAIFYEYQLKVHVKFSTLR